MAGVDFELQFKAALGDLRGANRQLTRINESLSSIAKASGKGFKETSKGMTGAVVKGALLVGALVRIKDIAFGAAKALIRLGVQSAAAFGKAISGATIFREKSIFAFKSLQKERGGLEMFEKVKDLAVEFGTPLNDTVNMFKKMAAAQFSMSESVTIFKRMQDLVRTTGAGAEELKRAMTAITQIQAKGRLQTEELLQLQESANLSQKLVFKQLGKQLGKSQKEIQKLLQTGKIDATTAIKAIQDAIGEKVGGGKPGEKAAEALNNTLFGMIDRVKNFGSILVDDIAEKVGPAFKQLKPILDDLMEAMRSDEAKAVIDEIAIGFNLILAGIQKAWPIAKAFFSGFVSEGGKLFVTIKEVAGKIAEAFGGKNQLTMKDAVATARVLGQIFAHVVAVIVIIGAVGAVAFGIIAVAIGNTVAFITRMGEAFTDAKFKIAEAVNSILDPIKNLRAEFSTTASSLGTGLIDGLVSGITGGLSRVVSAITNVAKSAISAAKATLKTGSPSKVFQGIGSNVSESFAGGVDFGAPSAATSMEELVQPSATALGAGAGGGGSTVNAGGINVTITVEGQGDAEATAQEVARILPVELSAAFERMGLEAGA